MRKFALLGVFLVLASTADAQPVQVLAPLPGSTTIDFNALLNQTPISNQYSALGVTVSSSCFQSESFYNAYYFPSSDPMQATNFDRSQRNGLDCAGGSGPYPTVTFNFASPINYFGLMGISNNIITLTDANGSISVLASVFSPGVASFVGFTDITGGSYVTISADDNGAFVIDDVSFRATATPEPSSAALLLTGIAGVVAVARRRRAKV